MSVGTTMDINVLNPSVLPGTAITVHYKRENNGAKENSVVHKITADLKL